jgi:hypothetical protein
LHLSAKLVHTNVGNGTSQATILQHAIHVQIFNHHCAGSLGIGLGFRHDVAGRLVQGVAPNIGNPVVQAGNPTAGLLAVTAASLLAGELALQTAQSPLRAVQGTVLYGQYRALGFS